MAYAVYKVKDLAAFSGRPELSYPTVYSATALAQALLLFKLATCLSAPPEDPTEAELVKMAILSMADNLVLSQEYQKASASPFSSESIGSYSYSKAAGKVIKREETGVMWFDLAVTRLGTCDVNDNIPSGGGIEMFEFSNRLVAGQGNNQRFLTPQDTTASSGWGFDLNAYYGGMP